MTEIEIAERLIASLGFPIAVSVYLLVRFDRLLRDLHEAVKELTDELRH